MRSDRYDTHHNNSNTPRYVLKSVLLFCFTFFSGTNGIIFTIKYLSDDREMLWWGIILGVVFMLLSVVNVLDTRLGTRKLPNIIAWACIFSLSVLILFFISGVTALIILLAEVFITISAVLIFDKIQRNRDAKKVRGKSE